MKGSVVLELVGFADDVKGPLADSLGIPPELLGTGRCGCDRPRWSVLPCGDCACESECDDCPENLIWRVLKRPGTGVVVRLRRPWKRGP